MDFPSTQQILAFGGTVIGITVSLAGLFAGIGYFRQGRAKSKLDAITIFKTEIEALTLKVNKQDADIKKMTQEISALKASITDKDAKLSELLSILQGRDPNSVKFTQMVQDYITANIPLLETIKTKTIPTIERLEVYLNKQAF